MRKQRDSLVKVITPIILSEFQSHDHQLDSQQNNRQNKQMPQHNPENRLLFPQNKSLPAKSLLAKILTDQKKQFLLLAACYALICVGLWLFYANPALSGSRLSKELAVWPATLLLLFIYWRGYRTFNQTVSQNETINAFPLSWIIISGVVLALLAALIPPFHSTDIFGYINRGWQQVHYGMNPYVYTIDHIQGWEKDPMITDHWVNNPSPYGFLYLQIVKGLCFLGGGQKAATIFIFKTGNVLAHLLTGFFIAFGVKRLNESGIIPQQNRICPRLSLYAYLWNPLILIHGLANGHNDLLMGFFVTLAAFFTISGGFLWILPSLMAATLIKYGTLVIVPFAGLFLLKQKKWTALLGGVALCLVLFFLTGASYLPDWQQFHFKEIGRNAFVSHGSLHSLVYSGYKTFAKMVSPEFYTHREAVRTLLKNLLLGAYLIFYIGLISFRFRQKNYSALSWIQDALLIMSTLICLISLKFYPWYLGMFFPLALLLPEHNGLRRFVIVLSGAQLFSITFIGQAHLLNFVVMTALPLIWVFGKPENRDWSSGKILAQPNATLAP